MFLFFHQISHQIHFGRGHGLTIIKGTSTQVASLSYQIVDHHDNLIQNLGRAITKDDITDNYHGKHAYLCDDGIFLFKGNDDIAIEPLLLYSDVPTMLSTGRASGEQREMLEEIITETIQALTKPHEPPTIFEYEKYASTEDTTSRLNLLNATREDTLNKNVYFRKKSTGELFPPNYPKHPFNTFLTLDGYYLNLDKNKQNRFSFYQFLPHHTANAAKNHFAAP